MLRVGEDAASTELAGALKPLKKYVMKSDEGANELAGAARGFDQSSKYSIGNRMSSKQTLRLRSAPKRDKL